VAPRRPCDGPDELAKALGGATRARTTGDAQLELPENPPGAYLASIAVEGFRGVGPEARLELTPGPGLTLVVGRNGSGKSSFAEGLELLMTGTNSRWVNRTKVWTEGWQNLHHDAGTVLTGELHVDGEPGTLTLRRSWPQGSSLQPGECSATRAGGSAVTLDELGWPAALSRYRPFLSYNELGQMFDELKTMYDALAAILGLEDIEELQRVLREARLARDRAQREFKAQVKDLIERLETVEDERAAHVLVALRARPADLDAIELALAGVGDGADPGADTATLRQLCSIAVPSGDAVGEALDRLAAAREAMARLAGTDAARAASLAGLLETALRHDESHQGPDCPVCGTGGVIDDRWRLATAREVVRLSEEAHGVEAAQREVAAAERHLADLLGSAPPAVVGRARDLELDPGRLEDAWEAWAEARRRVGDPDAGPAIASALGGIGVAAAKLAAAAERELERREDRWRPEARRLAEWLPLARTGVDAGEHLDELRAAEQWVKETAADLQAQRLAPIAGAAKHNWDRLRQASNVSLDGFHLRKRGNTRSAEVDVKVDGSDASAFGVMSQGELHALAVSVFLPRAALAESPFRFMVIDDPVQSMDPAKVDGLARVLDETAQARQVVLPLLPKSIFVEKTDPFSLKMQVRLQ
jgi:energy-coupling factor transporter ATP-binding protein EcfA2